MRSSAASRVVGSLAVLAVYGYGSWDWREKVQPLRFRRCCVGAAVGEDVGEHSGEARLLVKDTGAFGMDSFRPALAAARMVLDSGEGMPRPLWAASMGVETGEGRGELVSRRRLVLKEERKACMMPC